MKRTQAQKSFVRRAIERQDAINEAYRTNAEIDAQVQKIADVDFLLDDSQAYDTAPAAIDLSVEKQPASEDLKNALMILSPAEPSLIGDAVVRLITSALEKLEAEKLAAYEKGAAMVWAIHQQELSLPRVNG